MTDKLDRGYEASILTLRIPDFFIFVTVFLNLL